MGLETGTYISDLVISNPTFQDGISAGDDHLRLLKSVLQNTFPNIDGEVTVGQSELNRFTGFSGKNAEERKETLGLGDLAAISTIDNSTWDSSGDVLALSNGGTGASGPEDARDNLNLGSIATRDEQDNDLDTNSGRVPLIGNHGLGASTVSLSDSQYNGKTECGFYNADATATGANGIGTANHNILQWGSGARRTQLIGPGSGDSGLNLILKQYDSGGNSQGTSRVALEDTTNNFSNRQEFGNGAWLDSDRNFWLNKGSRCFSRSDDSTDWGWYDGANGNHRMRLTTGGDLHVDNNITAYSNSVGSDIRHKTEITSIDPKKAQRILDRVKPKVYWNEKLEQWDSGVVAQQFLLDTEGAEHLVSEVEDPDTGLTRLVFNYTGLSAYALAARQQDKRDNAVLEQRVNDLEERLRKLEASDEFSEE